MPPSDFAEIKGQFSRGRAAEKGGLTPGAVSILEIKKAEHQITIINFRVATACTHYTIISSQRRPAYQAPHQNRLSLKIC